MLQPELNSVNESANVIPKTDKQADIVRKIEELNRWKEEQKKLLEVRQIMQRKMLGVEQKTMYQALGLQSESVMTLEDGQLSEKLDNVVLQDCEKLEEYVEKSVGDGVGTTQLDEEDVDGEGCVATEPKTYMTLTSANGNEVCKNLHQIKPKKPFLRRGEGLKQRFKIDPDELKLNNLPKYKYANAHPRLRLKPINKFNKLKDSKTNSTNMAKFPTTNTKTSGTVTTLDAQEQRFQNLLITSKNTYSSTPDTKSSFGTNKTVLANSKNSFPNADEINFSKSDNHDSLNKFHENQPKDDIKNQKAVAAIAWSKILDPLEIKPVQVPRNCKQSLPETEESIFELLEQKANEGSFDMDSTCLKEFMMRRITEQLNETDNIPVNEQLKSKRLEPLILAEKGRSGSSTDEEEEQSQLTEDMESIESDDTTHKTIETANFLYPQQASQVRVRFSDSNETHEYENEAETTLNDTSRLSAGTIQQEGQGDTSKNELFTQFKQALFAALQMKADQHLANDSSVNSTSDITLVPKDSVSPCNSSDINNMIYNPACKELQEKTDMIKIRLAELEREIQVFKDNNIALMKAKQEHELQKSLNAQQHIEAMDNLKDEKIRMEIYLHDERVKLEEEKRQFEQKTKMKTQGLFAKERKECDRLKEQVTQLEMQLKSKESNHTAAQARLRTQIRNLEREQSKLHEQIENLTRENKRLENENLKISREQNNKILLEINRNIAKLAPKQIQHTSISIPDEGPPTLGASRTLSKSIVATATANKNFRKTHKATSSRYSNFNQILSNKSPPKMHKEAQTTETGLIEEKEKHPKQQNYVMNHDEDDDDSDDILREFQMTPEKESVTLTKENDNKKSPHKQQQNQVPVPPPPSPRSSGGCSNINTKREIVNDDGSKDIWYPNGNLKKISADGMVIRMLYFNKDIKETNINEGTVKYYYAETNTWHTTYLDGLEILEFANGQVEHRHKNGVVEVHYPNNSVKIMDPKDENKQEEWRFPDGTHLVQMRNGDKILSLANGQKEIHNKLHKRREYPDGTVKIVYPDGSTETRYSNGRIRLKDKDGKLVMDTDVSK